MVGLRLETVQRWLDSYSHAWETYDPADISALFTDDAEYRWHPWAEGSDVTHGRQRIVAVWLENRDVPGTYRGLYRPILVQDDLAIAVGTTSYYTDDSQTTLDRAYHNLWILRFAEDGRCSSFTEWFMQSPDRR